MVASPFIAHPPGSQDTDTYRQFVELQAALRQIIEKSQELEARIKALEPPS